MLQFDNGLARLPERFYARSSPISAIPSEYAIGAIAVQK
jgi:hypothetical protein